MKKLLIGASLIGLVAAPALANHQWGRYHWAGTAPIALRINTSIGSQWNTSVNTAISDWDQSNVLTLSGPFNSNTNPSTCNPISGQIVVCSAAYGINGWLGIASVWAFRGEISQATTKLNDSYYSQSYANGAYDTPAWRALVACQEIGHDFGLDHQDENFSNANLGTCMDYTNDPSTNQHPNQHDYDQLVTMYSGGKKGGGGGKPGGKPDRNNPFAFREVGKSLPEAVSHREFGTAIGFDAGGRADLFEKDVGNGVKLITHVFWVPGEEGDRHAPHR